MNTRNAFGGNFLGQLFYQKIWTSGQIRAYYHNGILMVKIPKKEDKSVRRVEIRTDF
jgi:retron-type reverse transcriptase